ncbi:MAG TPA: type II toxin-antitoxin system RelB/DinJ family antitoxin [bacterium]|nr:type II toxin-antitoxin system RelB/DinJ family antitoxin [bacterium]HPN45749.1 type II toxin-antitoxin system RelB/DinJ family antitoxin [bacterium]
MNKTSTVRAVISPQKKENVAKILKKMGLNHSEAINIFYSLIEEYKGFPFELKLPENVIHTGEESMDPELITHLKASIRKNRKLGELLAQ